MGGYIACTKHLKKRVLLIDNPEMRDNIAEILELSGYEVSTAATGKLGIELIHKQHSYLII